MGGGLRCCQLARRCLNVGRCEGRREVRQSLFGCLPPPPTLARKSKMGDFVQAVPMGNHASLFLRLGRPGGFGLAAYYPIIIT